ncbi:hypothetical protein BI364_04690 [Acidihalobacter yilgarnensis]|uniref:Glycosyl hydrolase family 13 catalytic domain-containing protein n=1 Tax=Acidihalobacter yilgarnensis TaxID=2819280 RepID=A0A1D8ILR1_9GAMM|nr:sugar phosphorylase [Acidihalobacter yilgarnensis]AOU97378.1 hypothetical protein BI364_04690 [Acidihalobacter yilgarnensis]
MSLSRDVKDRATELLSALYGCEAAQDTLTALEGLLAEDEIPSAKTRTWPALSERDALLITYGNTFSAPGEPPLGTLLRFLKTHVGDAISLVHLLPIFPYSSDDGFSVVNYLEVSPELGGWEDVAKIGEQYGLTLDLVLNHCSRSHLWFQDYIRGEAPGRDYFVEADPADPRLALVTRPRNSPLLTPVEVRDQGSRWVWTTFSADQVDLDFANPAVLLEYVRILLTYIRRGARVVRLDAVAYLWKTLGTPCINLPETHAVVKCLRLIVDAAVPGTLLLTETNVPQVENLSYFGEGNEAHLIYQFSLAPLLLYALTLGRTAALQTWAAELPPPPVGGGYVNFTASHDGVGLRPLEGLVSEADRDALLRRMRERGGYVSMRRLPDGRDAPYELNISYFTALGGDDGEAAQLARFLLAQTVALSLQGVPALYVQSLIATESDLLGVERSGQTRAINRRRWDYGELNALLAREGSVQIRCLNEIVRRLTLRRAHRAFHPEAGQRVLDTEDGIFAVLRTPRAEPGSQAVPVLCLFNFTPETREADVAPLCGGEGRQSLVDVIGNRRIACPRGLIRLPAYAALWLKAV